MKDKDGNFCRYVPDKILLDKRLSPTAKIFYLIMCRFPPFGCADINIWAQACGISKYQATKVFNELIDAGYITKKYSKYRTPGSSRYFYELLEYCAGYEDIRWVFYLKVNTKPKQATESSSAPSE